MKKLAASVIIVTLALSCGAKRETAQATAPASNDSVAVNAPATPTSEAGVAPATDSAATPPAAAQPSVVASKLTGTVLETMDASGYTYMKLKTAGGEQWAATPQTKVKKGQSVTLLAQMTAEKFESSTLHRTFDRIVFATIADGNVAPAAQTAAASAMPAGHPAMPAGMGGGMSAMGSPADHMKPKVDVGDLKVDRAEGANAKTVAELWAERASLNGKPVVVRGKVVKFLGGIMGTNFMHLRDGSGSEAKGDHDLTVTTSEGASVGDVVTISGTVHVDKDFGAGYRYPVIVEGASVKK
jgi:hypothetical protein